MTREKPEVVYYREITVKGADGHSRVAIKAKRGTKRTTLIVMTDHGLRALEVSNDEARYMRPVEYKGAPYPLRRAISKFRAVGRKLGQTKSAKNALALCVAVEQI